jgi:hypothetical protein
MTRTIQSGARSRSSEPGRRCRTTPAGTRASPARRSARREGTLAQVEIDAPTAINPAELNRMAEAAIAPYLEPELAARAAELQIA